MLTPEQQMRLRCLEEANRVANNHGWEEPYQVVAAAEMYWKFVQDGTVPKTED